MQVAHPVEQRFLQSAITKLLQVGDQVLLSTVQEPGQGRREQTQLRGPALGEAPPPARAG